MFSTKKYLAAIGAASVALSPAIASAGGLFVPGVGPHAMARAGAFVARADDPSALSHNPAGLAKGTGTTVLIGANFLNYALTYQRAGSYEQPAGEAPLPYAGQPFAEVKDVSKPNLGFGGFQAVPILAISTDLGLKIKGLRFGFGVIAPQGYPERSIDADYELEQAGAPPPARYDIIAQEAVMALPSAAVAYRLNDKINLGARLSWGVASLTARTFIWGIRNYEEWIARDGDFIVDVKDNFVPAFGVGAQYAATQNIEIGFAYSSALDIQAKGTGDALLGSNLGIGGDQERVLPNNDTPLCASGGEMGALKACVNVPIPMTASLGARYIFTDGAGVAKGDIELDVKWENWSNASDYDIIVDGIGEISNRFIEPAVMKHGFQDVISVRLGGSYDVPVMGKPLALRAGAAYDTAAAKEGWERVDMDGAARTTLAGGIAYTFGNARVDLGGGVVLEGARDVAECNPTVTMMGCDGSGTETPGPERNHPDPVQPLQGAGNQTESPFNAGHYESGYVIFSLGLSTWF